MQANDCGSPLTFPAASSNHDWHLKLWVKMSKQLLAWQPLNRTVTFVLLLLWTAVNAGDLWTSNLAPLAGCLWPNTWKASFVLHGELCVCVASCWCLNSYFFTLVPYKKLKWLLNSLCASLTSIIHVPYRAISTLYSRNVVFLCVRCCLSAFLLCTKEQRHLSFSRGYSDNKEVFWCWCATFPRPHIFCMNMTALVFSLVHPKKHKGNCKRLWCNAGSDAMLQWFAAKLFKQHPPYYHSLLFIYVLFCFVVF